MIEARQAVDRLQHQMAGVEGEDDLVVAFDPELLRQELAMAGRLLPVDEAGIEPGDVLAQRIELGALALLVLRLGAIDGALAERLEAGPKDMRAEGRIIDLVAERLAHPAFDQAERTAPAQPQSLQFHDAAPQGRERQMAMTPRRASKADVSRRRCLQRAVKVDHRLDAHRADGIGRVQSHLDRAFVADGQARGGTHRDAEAAPAQTAARRPRHEQRAAG